jgi:hypothetical protein
MPAAQRRIWMSVKTRSRQGSRGRGHKPTPELGQRSKYTAHILRPLLRDSFHFPFHFRQLRTLQNQKE